MAKETPVEKLTYEQAFEEMDKLVAALESGDLPLEESLALFERGQALAQRCMALLDQAELKVQQLTEDGEVEDFEE
jgi:exodeoxyribonuclease VII small subunit